ncbi:hypothetical protein [Oceanivirga salmonicida]|uniref:hypothetical protein n=1 Tax=Oceanivirga salmonicida TaxID=1769291 RepID=UPI0008370139|nr:hypothetical protein [Oceanivirga salmonicida]
MYSYGDEFKYEIDGNMDYYTCLTTIKIKENEYIVAENEYGLKKIFLIEDEDDEIISEVDEEDEEAILDIYERQSILDGDFYINDDDDFNIGDNDTDYDDEDDDTFIHDDIDLDDDIEEEIDLDIDDLFEEIFNNEN